ncbi:MAG: T9SS C-terminal target domain-containing protein [Calditrichaeota bacterium]|nr:MAG: T9SS C-terminal target domain-containing protein [Calditrichota bacterium]
MWNSELGFRKWEWGIPDRGRPEWVTLKIYDIPGREVKTLINQRLRVGRYTVQWDGTDEAGRPVTSGVYLYRLQAGEQILTRKMVLMR